MIEQTRLPTISDARYPLFCQWEITCRCNLHCVMCYTDCFNRPDKIRQELSTSEILLILDELAEAGCMELVLTGGEPLARPDFFTVYEYAKQKGFLITLYTNGTLITPVVADRLASLPPFQIEISLHGITKSTFEGVTAGEGSHERCLKAIELILERQIPLVLKCTAMTINKEEILEVKRLAEQWGPRVRFRMGDTMRSALDGSDAPHRFQLSDAEADLLEIQDPQIWKEACARSEEKSTCQSGMITFHIDAYGQLQLCGGNRRESYDLRSGDFRTGFYEFLPKFPCPLKTGGCIERSLCGSH